MVLTMTSRQRAQSVVMPAASQVPTTGPLGYGGIILMGMRGVVDGTTSGTPEQVAELVARLQGQAGAVPMDMAAVASELQKTWNRADAEEWAQAYTQIFPPYQLLIESYGKAREVEKGHETLDSQRT